MAGGKITAILLAAVLVGGCSDASENKVDPVDDAIAQANKADYRMKAEPPAYTFVSVQDFISQYYGSGYRQSDSLNPIYYEKSIQVTGKVGCINDGCSDADLDGDGDARITFHYFGGDPETEAKFKQLHDGQVITLKGQCEGDNGVYIGLGSCTLIGKATTSKNKQ